MAELLTLQDDRWREARLVGNDQIYRLRMRQKRKLPFGRLIGHTLTIGGSRCDIRLNQVDVAECVATVEGAWGPVKQTVLKARVDNAVSVNGELLTKKGKGRKLRKDDRIQIRTGLYEYRVGPLPGPDGLLPLRRENALRRTFRRLTKTR